VWNLVPRAVHRVAETPFLGGALVWTACEFGLALAVSRLIGVDRSVELVFRQLAGDVLA
jgi:hypothetical protein